MPLLLGAGVVWLSELCVADAVANGQLIQLSTRRLALQRSLYPLRLHNRTPSAPARAFLALIRYGVNTEPPSPTPAPATARS